MRDSFFGKFLSFNGNFLYIVPFIDKNPSLEHIDILNVVINNITVASILRQTSWAVITHWCYIKVSSKFSMCLYVKDMKRRWIFGEVIATFTCSVAEFKQTTTKTSNLIVSNQIEQIHLSRIRVERNKSSTFNSQQKSWQLFSRLISIPREALVRIFLSVIRKTTKTIIEHSVLQVWFCNLELKKLRCTACYLLPHILYM